MASRGLHINLAQNGFGGVEYFIHSLLDGLSGHGLVLAKGSALSHYIHSQNPHYKFFEFDKTSLLSWLHLCRFIFDFEYIHFHRVHDLWLVVILSLVRPFWQVNLSIHNHFKPERIGFIRWRLNKEIYNSDYMRKKYSISDKKSLTIYPLIQSDQPNPNNDIQLGTPTLLIAGALCKNQEIMLRVLPTIQSRYPNVKLILTASGGRHLQVEGNDKKELLLVEFARLGLSKNVEIIEDLARADYLHLLQRVDVSLHTNHNEPFGITVWEATVMHKKIVSFNSGGVVEILKNYPLARLVNTEEEFTNAIGELLQLQETYEWERQNNLQYKKTLEQYSGL